MADQPQETPAQPSVEDAQSIATAGAVAAEGAEPAERPVKAKRAMRAQAQKLNWEIPDEVLDQFAKMFEESEDRTAEKTIDKLEARGGFDTIPEKVQPVEPVLPPAPGDTPQAPPQAPVSQPQPKKSWAQRFMDT